MLTLLTDRTNAVRVAFPPRDAVLPYATPPSHQRFTTPHAWPPKATGPADETSLDANETTGNVTTQAPPPPPTPDTSPCSSFRHSGWEQRRKRVYAAMQQLELSPNRLRRFAQCGQRAWVEGSNPSPLSPEPVTTPAGVSVATVASKGHTRYRVRCNTCRDRFCTPCAATRARTVAHAIIGLLGDQPARFITLTIRSNDAPLTEQIDRLYRSFRRLRKTTLWVRHCYAAAATLEVTRNKTTQRWHPHLHVLAKGKYIPHADLKAEWLRITKDSPIVDIRLVKHREKAIRYLSKYVTKPMTHEYDTQPDALAEAITALKGRRLILLTGEWKNLTVAEQHDNTTWTYVATLDSLLRRGIDGDATAVEILGYLRSDTSSWQTQTGKPP